MCAVVEVMKILEISQNIKEFDEIAQLQLDDDILVQARHVGAYRAQ